MNPYEEKIELLEKELDGTKNEIRVLKDIINVSPVGITALDMDGRFIYASSQAERSSA